MPAAANIGVRERAKRRLLGWVSIAVTAAAAVVLLAAGAPRAWRVALVVPALFGALGLLQARAGTCVALAACGLKNLDQGADPIGDPGERRAITRQAGRLTLQAVAIAAGVTLLFLLV